jgi:hypothetical protein
MYMLMYVSFCCTNEVENEEQHSFLKGIGGAEERLQSKGQKLSTQ